MATAFDDIVLPAVQRRVETWKQQLDSDLSLALEKAELTRDSLAGNEAFVAVAHRMLGMIEQGVDSEYQPFLTHAVLNAATAPPEAWRAFLACLTSFTDGHYRILVVANDPLDYWQKHVRRFPDEAPPTGTLGNRIRVMLPELAEREDLLRRVWSDLVVTKLAAGDVMTYPQPMRNDPGPQITALGQQFIEFLSDPFYMPPPEPPKPVEKPPLPFDRDYAQRMQQQSIKAIAENERKYQERREAQRAAEEEQRAAAANQLPRIPFTQHEMVQRVPQQPSGTEN